MAKKDIMYISRLLSTELINVSFPQIERCFPFQLLSIFQIVPPLFFSMCCLFSCSGLEFLGILMGLHQSYTQVFGRNNRLPLGPHQSRITHSYGNLSLDPILIQRHKVGVSCFEFCPGHEP
jgi:hypothetical protein